MLHKIVLLAACASANVRSKMILKNTGNEDLALYFMGSINDGDMSMWDGSETLNSIVEPGGATARYVNFNDSFAVRSGDMTWRTRFSLYENEHDEQRYKISFHNVMVEEVPEPIELKHHDDGYLWIDQAHQTVQATAAGHRFVVRDAKHRDRFALEIHLPDWDE